MNFMALLVVSIGLALCNDAEMADSLTNSTYAPARKDKDDVTPVSNEVDKEVKKRSAPTI